MWRPIKVGAITIALLGGFSCYSPTDLIKIRTYYPAVVEIFNGYGGGSGFHIGNGLFITAKHVVGNIVDVKIVCASVSYPAKVLCLSDSDVAIVECCDLDYLPKIDTSHCYIEPLDECYVIGYFFGAKLYNKGYIRYITDDFIVVSSQAWYGTSGSPVVNKHGRLIGIVQAIMSSGRDVIPQVTRIVPAKVVRDLINSYTLN